MSDDTVLSVPFNLLCSLFDLDAAVGNMSKTTFDLASCRGVEIRADPHMSVLAGGACFTPALFSERSADGCLCVDLDVWVQTLILGAGCVLEM